MSTASAIPNPFVYGQVLIPGKSFCSRPKLESSVLEAAVHQQRIVLLGERRMGKSSLVEHTLTRPDRVLVAVVTPRLRLPPALDRAPGPSTPADRHTRVASLFAGSARGSMLELFTAEGSHFYQSAMILDVGPIPQADMARFFREQFARGKRDLSADTLQAIFALAGESPNDQQQLAYHLWTQSTPARLGQEELKRAFSPLLAEVSRRGELT